MPDIVSPKPGAAFPMTRINRLGPATFHAIFDAVALGNNKYVASVMNTSTTKDVVIQLVRVYHANLDAVTGVITEFEFRKVSALTAATAVTPIALDASRDTLASGITLDAAGASVTDLAGGLIARFHRTGEELIVTAADFLLSSAQYPNTIAWQRGEYGKGLTLSGATAANRGCAVKCVTNTTAGDINVEIVFTVEDVS